MNKSRNRKVQISNYIPHKTPRRVDFLKWVGEYKPQLINLYTIFIEVMEKRYPDFEFNPDSFSNFVKMIFHSSSKYIQNSV
jgi:hypothetical protein